MTFDDNCPMMMEREFGAPDHVPKLSVGFCMHPSEDKHKTVEAGHPVFKEREYVKIEIPGDSTFLHFQPATDKDRRMFPNAYQAFKNRESTPVVEGMPIELWPQVTRPLAMTLRAMSIHTVEALAEVNDANIAKVGINGQELRAKAKAFLGTAKDSAVAQKLAAENQKLQDQISAMQAQIAALAKADKRKVA
jgi:hypothetical protein